MKKKVVCILCSAIALVLGFFVIAPAEHKSYAETTEDEVVVITESTVITSDYFMSAELYQIMVRISNTIKIENGETTNLNILRAGDLKSIKELDLTYGRISFTYNSTAGVKTHKIYEDTGEEGWTNVVYKISDLTGFESLIFGSEFNTLILDNNAIVTIDSTIFERMFYLNNLSIKNNGLTTVNFLTTTPIKNLYLQGNNMQEIDLTCLKQNGVNPAECHLENNDFADVSKITLPDPAATTVALYLAQNYLTDTQKSDPAFTGHRVSLLVQGIKAGAQTIRFTNNTYIRVTPDTMAEGFAEDNLITAKAFYREGSDFYQAGQEAVSTTDAEGKLLLYTGRLVIKFYQNDVEITSGDYAAKNVDIYPDAPTMRVEIDGKLQEKNPATVKGTFKVIAMAPEGSFVEIRFAGTEWSEGNYITVEESGEYTIYAQVTIDGLTSEMAQIVIKNTSTTRMMWGLIIIIGAVVLIIGGMYLFRWFKAGAIVAPLNDQEIAREQIRQDRQRRKDNNG